MNIVDTTIETIPIIPFNIAIATYMGYQVEGVRGKRVKALFDPPRFIRAIEEGYVLQFDYERNMNALWPVIKMLNTNGYKFKLKVAEQQCICTIYNDNDIVTVKGINPTLTAYCAIARILIGEQ